MEELYWLRHRRLIGHQGPFQKKELRSAIDAAAFPRDSEVLRDMGVSEQKREDSNSWMPVTELLGLDAAPSQASQAAAPASHFPPAAEAQQQQRLSSLRRISGYPKTRLVIQVGMFALVFIELVLLGVQLDALPPSTRQVPILRALIAIPITVAVGNVLLAVLDIADTAVRNSGDVNDT